MGIGAWWHWVVVLIIVVLVFGTKKLKNIGSDVGGAVNEFKKAMKENKGEQVTDDKEESAAGTTIEGEITSKKCANHDCLKQVTL